MKFKIIATIVVIIVLLISTVVYLASRNTSETDQTYEEVQ